MKKSLLALSAAAMLICISSCKNDADSKKADDQSDNTTKTEQVTTTERPKTLADINKEKSEKFLNGLKKNNKDVTFTESGLGYKVIKDAQGPKPSPTSVVKVKYTGKHIDGSVFDSSEDQAIEFPLNGVIAGFSEGIQKMSKGAIYELYIPADLGYGLRGAPGAIGPNEALIFDIELVDFQ